METYSPEQYQAARLYFAEMWSQLGRTPQHSKESIKQAVEECNSKFEDLNLSLAFDILQEALGQIMKNYNAQDLRKLQEAGFDIPNSLLGIHPATYLDYSLDLEELLAGRRQPETDSHSSTSNADRVHMFSYYLRVYAQIARIEPKAREQPKIDALRKILEAKQ